ncbi:MULTISPECIES: transglutaminase-like domain-containing protein [Sphingobium]|uniref:transglutaminase-like domain-containing protein n=1 Tax=Sphingobium TaxID=165695 RepID=UPI001BE5ECD3|nr:MULTISPECIES: transglutaminase family protein [Sphingobium]MBT2244998.1 transglutaminase family protein [Sphingobium sp. BHU LFT2]WBQ19359.1 transglutaminase family protein [Sphingobium yanoikuyae]
MLIRAGYDLKFRAFASTPMIAMLNIRPERVIDLKTGHVISADRDVPMDHYYDAFGNLCSRMTMPPGVTTLSCDFVIEDDGTVDRQSPGALQHEVADLPPDVLMYLFGSRYCETEHLSNIAWGLFGHVPAGWQRVQAIVDFVHQHLAYGYQYARATRTAYEAYQEGVGVCRDFAHLAVALCRCMNIPARYCSGYLGDIGIDPVDIPMDFHAWFEVYLSGEWHSFDARHRVPRVGRILMACGRDAADTALTTAFGSVQLIGFKVHTDEVRDDVVRPCRLAA